MSKELNCHGCKEVLKGQYLTLCLSCDKDKKYLVCEKCYSIILAILKDSLCDCNKYIHANSPVIF